MSQEPISPIRKTGNTWARTGLEKFITTQNLPIEEEK